MTDAKSVQSNKYRHLSNIIFAIAIFGVIVILSMLVYGLLDGKFMSDEPKTSIENKYQLALAAVKKNPADGQNIANLAEAQYAEGDTGAAFSTLNKGEKATKGKLPDALYVMAARLGILNNQKKYTETISYAKKAKDMSDAWIVKQSQAFNGKTTNYLTTTDSGLVVDVGWNLGMAYEHEKNWKEAQKMFEMVIQYAPTLADAWYYHGIASLELGDRAQAIDSLKRAADFYPDDAGIKQALKKAEALPKKETKK